MCVGILFFYIIKKNHTLFLFWWSHATYHSHLLLYCCTILSPWSTFSDVYLIIVQSEYFLSFGKWLVLYFKHNISIDCSHSAKCEQPSSRFMYNWHFHLQSIIHRLQMTFLRLWYTEFRMWYSCCLSWVWADPAWCQIVTTTL